LRQGAIGYLEKPVSKDSIVDALSNIKGFIDRERKRLLIIDANHDHREGLVELIAGDDVEISTSDNGEEAIAKLQEGDFDCVVLGLELSDMPGIEFIRKVQKEIQLPDLPMVIYTGQELTQKQENEIRKISNTVVAKEVQSPERLLDETSLFLHRVEANLPEYKRKMLEEVHQTDPVLRGRKVLIVDDDVRNIFALTSILERQEMNVLYAESGKEALEILEESPDVSVVLMDIMLPGMDGYEATMAIREMPKFKTLPIIALTAKAMKGDREKCLDSGASDYIAKPVDTDKLLSLLRVWLYR